MTRRSVKTRLRILLGVLLGDIRTYLVRDIGTDQLPNTVSIRPGDIAEVIETPDNIRKPRFEGGNRDTSVQTGLSFAG